MIESHRRILIVDDNTDIHDDFKKILIPQISSNNKDTVDKLSEGIFSDSKNPENKTIVDEILYDIDDAYQGEEAITKIETAEKQKRPYSLVFMDVRMPPGIDGIETVKKIWQKYPFTEVVLCTAYSDYSWGELQSFFGETDHLLFVKKPFDQVEIKQTALTLTKKWDLNRKNRNHTSYLENEITYVLKELANANSLLKEKNKEIINFVHIITHDLRNPLTALLHNLQMLKLQQQSSHESTEEIFEFSHETINYMNELINDLLDMAEWEFGKAKLEKSDVDMYALVETIIKRLLPRLKDKKITILNTINVTIKADRKALNKIFMNLVGNAINYIGNPKDPMITLNAVSNNGGYTFTVRDNGIGIPKDQHEKIFKKFVRGNANRETKGNGIGLATVKNMVESHGGKIWVDSSVGEGSAFSFFLPNS